MSAFDKHLIIQKLLELGWKEKDEDSYELIPPNSLWANKPESFYVYQAAELQNLLAPESIEE